MILAMMAATLLEEVTRSGLARERCWRVGAVTTWQMPSDVIHTAMPHLNHSFPKPLSVFIRADPEKMVRKMSVGPDFGGHNGLCQIGNKLLTKAKRCKCSYLIFGVFFFN